MAVRDDFTAGEVLAAADLNDTFGSKSNSASPRFTGDVGIGTAAPANDVHVYATGGTSAATVTAEALMYLQDAGAGVGNGGGILVGANQGSFAMIKGFLSDGAANSAGFLSFGLRASSSDANLTERMRINTDGYIQGTGTSLGAYAAYTPTISGTGWAIGNGTSAGVLSGLGKRINFLISITFGSTSTFGGAGLVISLPVTTTASNPSFNAFAVDVSTAEYYTLPTLIGSTTTCKPHAIQNASGFIQEVISTKPFTWANGDQIFISGSFEGA
jgi:hypothetical protein